MDFKLIIRDSDENTVNFFRVFSEYVYSCVDVRGQLLVFSLKSHFLRRSLLQLD